MVCIHEITSHGPLLPRPMGAFFGVAKSHSTVSVVSCVCVFPCKTLGQVLINQSTGHSWLNICICITKFFATLFIPVHILMETVKRLSVVDCQSSNMCFVQCQYFAFFTLKMCYFGMWYKYSASLKDIRVDMNGLLGRSKLLEIEFERFELFQFL